MTKESTAALLWEHELNRSAENVWDDGIGLAAQCAELPEGMEGMQKLADGDPDFRETLDDWVNYVFLNELWLAVEQACDETGVLLPYPQRGARLETCPEEWVEKLRYVMHECPPHVLAHLTVYTSTCVRIERARRTGAPTWSPQTATLEPEARAFFNPPKVLPRSYAR